MVSINPPQKKNKGRLALVIGHTKKQQGATGANPMSLSEYEYNSDLATLIKAFGEQHGCEVEIFRRDRVGIRGAYKQVSTWGPHATIELHFNAYNTRVTGTETLYSDSEDDQNVQEKQLAEIIQKNMCGVFHRQGRGDRGLKDRPRTKAERGWYNVNQATNYASILIEPFFGDNKRDATLAIRLKQELAESLICGFVMWMQRFNGTDLKCPTCGR